MLDPRITEYSYLTHTLGTLGGTKEQWERWNWLYKEVVSPLLEKSTRNQALTTRKRGKK
ncbi:hypothetical protein [Nitrosospira sp. NpAV]|uniref:hypothetical protein n=1 Tax=Nitrosospira sp. NpAV TaxID=58133 RepID=UPI0012EC24A3|nr:hypothetical protein [Nitrosospira sp. NpAV]